MAWYKKGELLYELHLKQIPWLKHFFTLRSSGDLNNLRTRKKIRAEENINFSSLVSGEQVHRDLVYRVKSKDAGKRILRVDGLITDLSKLPLVVFTADCLPIFFVDRKNKIIGLTHAGREGTFKRIAYKTVKKLVRVFNSNPVNILVVIGPHIHSCCYPVNLTKLNYEQLLSAGIKKKNIFVSRYCTACRNDLFFSYRLEKEKAGRMMGLIMIS